MPAILSVHQYFYLHLLWLEQSYYFFIIRHSDNFSLFNLVIESIFYELLLTVYLVVLRCILVCLLWLGATDQSNRHTTHRNPIYFLLKRTLNLFLLKNNMSVSLCPRRFCVSYSSIQPYFFGRVKSPI
jgi:hypothetical protein